MAEKIPVWAMQDKYWHGTIYLFMNHRKLQRVFNTKYFDFDEAEIKVAALKRVSKAWSESEKFMLNLALHLHDVESKISLSGIDCLDDRNKQLALEAIKLRFF